MPVTTRLRSKLENEFWRASRNPCTLPNFLVIMKEQAGKDELYNLRQLSTQYNKLFNSTYFDLAEKCAVIEASYNSGTDETETEEPRNYLSKISKELPHIYRRLEIRSLGCMDLEAGTKGQEVKDFLRIIGPFIKVLDIYPLPRISRGVILPILQELLDLNSFQNLTTLNLRFDFDELADDTIKMRNVLAQFPLTTCIKIHRLHMFSASDFIRVTEILDTLKNVEFYGDCLLLRRQEIVPLEQLFASTNKWLYGSKFAFQRVWFLERTATNSGNVANMIRSLDLILGLSKCNRFDLDRSEGEYNWELSDIPNQSCWKQNIRELNLDHYSAPLLFLRDFPNLWNLELNDSDLAICLLSNVTESDEDNLKAVFEGLNNLQVVTFRCGEDEQQEHYETTMSRLEPYLKSLVRNVRNINEIIRRINNSPINKNVNVRLI